MSDEFTPNVIRQESDPRYNAEGGIAIIQGSAHQREMAKFEQFPHSKWAFGNPGNPYTYRPFPKMLYKAERWNGKLACQEAPPQRYEFKDDKSFILAEEATLRWNANHQLTVKDEVEMSRAMESGWRETPQDALDFAHARDEAHATAIAHTNYEDRHLSDAAKAEKLAAENEAGEPLPEIAAKPRGRRSAA